MGGKGKEERRKRNKIGVENKRGRENQSFRYKSHYAKSNYLTLYSIMTYCNECRVGPFKYDITICVLSVVIINFKTHLEL